MGDALVSFVNRSTPEEVTALASIAFAYLLLRQLIDRMTAPEVVAIVVNGLRWWADFWRERAIREGVDADVGREKLRIKRAIAERLEQGQPLEVIPGGADEH